MVDGLWLSPSGLGFVPSLGQKSVIDYVITDSQLMKESGDVQVDATDRGVSDRSLVWLELGKVSKGSRKRKRMIRRWRIDRFLGDEGRDIVRH